MTTRCPLCGEDVQISGTLEATGTDMFRFVSDENGTKAAWGHQDKHDRQDAAQAPQDGANGGDVGSGKGEGVSTPQTGAQAPGEERS
jgi:hypothetical protein